MAKVAVTLTPTVAQPDKAKAKGSDNIEWTPNGNNTITLIDFGRNQSIFSSPPAPVGGSSKVWQGTLKADAPLGTYKYDFQLAGYSKVDPEIEIGPPH
jgi:hypothetical protein